jgi:Ca-activated chloride channel family protein
MADGKEGEQSSEQEQGSEQADDKDKSGDMADESSEEQGEEGSEQKDDAMAGTGEEDKDKEGRTADETSEEDGPGGEQKEEEYAGEGDQEEKDVAGDQKASSTQDAKSRPEDFIPGKDDRAISQFDQLDSAGQPDDESLNKLAIPGGEGDPENQGMMLMMEAWLEQAEGNPSLLLKNQFMIEEQRYMQTRGRRLHEIRPW